MPSSALDFILPSIYDGKPLECRLHFPAERASGRGEEGESCAKYGAILAHPYGPLGGSYDDPVVGALTKELLREGFVVGNFNFRGAGGSGGRTSWSAKPEVADYVSFAGFFIHYLHHLQSGSSQDPSLARDGEMQASADIHLVLGGYSYGSLITTLLPATGAMLDQFSGLSASSLATDIVTRASVLAAQRNAIVASRREAQIKMGRRAAATAGAPPHLVVKEGEALRPSSPRPSRSIRRSLDHVRVSLSLSRPRPPAHLRIRRRSAPDHRAGSSSSSNSNEASASASASRLPFRSTLPRVLTYYVLVSPLLPPISSLATLSFLARSPAVRHRHETLTRHPTLVVYGDRDGFTSTKKVRRWVAEMAPGDDDDGGGGPPFQACEVLGAGHFWREDGVEPVLRWAVRRWVQQRVRVHAANPDLASNPASPEEEDEEGEGEGAGEGPGPGLWAG
ncbi:MAG: hypothetical protein M1826_000059 [Phylliscum demangeonii]|nr:MAG: hypothetical protein M1826_000059 [Phylliscum demangeonii]